MDVIRKIKEMCTEWGQIGKIIVEEERCTICKQVKKCIYIIDSEYEGAPVCPDCVTRESEVYQFVEQYMNQYDHRNVCRKNSTMTEIDYIKVSNRIKVSLALQIMKDVLPGDEYGITKDMYKEITTRLSYAQDKLFASYEIA